MFGDRHASAVYREEHIVAFSKKTGSSVGETDVGVFALAVGWCQLKFSKQDASTKR